MAEPCTLVVATSLPASRLHRAFVDAFADYLIGPFEIELDAWPGFLARQGVDLALSRVAVDASGPLAFALVAPRPRRSRWRLATMGAIPAARGSGAARSLLDDTIARATAAAMSAVELEVFAANEAACRLYRGRGFEPVQALYGHERAPGPVDTGGDAAAAVPPVDEVAVDAALAWLDDADDRIADLPLQVTPAALSSMRTTLRAWQRGSAQLVFGEIDDASIVVRSLVDRVPAQHDARVLVEALVARHPDRRIRVPQLQRDDLGGDALAAAGFVRLPQHQWLMLRQAAA